MEIDFSRVRLPQPALPDGYTWLAWDPSLLDRHAQVKYDSFHTEIDSRVFACLGEHDGCRRLMFEIARQRNFLPSATWLISQAQSDAGAPATDCGTIQGLYQSRYLGAVQNVGVVPEHRGLGLGRALMLKSLEGFRSARLRRVYLEVTEENTPAVELYSSIGFRLARTMYKAVEAEPAGAI
jgi:ribosomal protein S18 acetylase RimI-like enzyme